MGVVSLDAEMTIAAMVEAMLPRFSDEDLGILFGVDVGLDDYGYDESGNKREREPFGVRKYPWYLFCRPSNYTKVFFWMPDDDAKGLGLNPLYCEELVWREIADHDSCWRDGVGSSLTKLYFGLSELFNGRKIGGRDIRPCDLSQHFYPNYSTPCYVRFIKKESVHPEAKPYSDASREKRIAIRRAELKDIRSDDNSRLFLK